MEDENRAAFPGLTCRGPTASRAKETGGGRAVGGRAVTPRIWRRAPAVAKAVRGAAKNFLNLRLQVLSKVDTLQTIDLKAPALHLVSQ